MSANDSPTVFTDEQLVSMKEKWVAERYEMRPDEIEALLNRLDAAEAVIPFLLVVCQDDRESIEYSAGVVDEAEQAYDAWRKVAGKSPVVRTK